MAVWLAVLAALPVLEAFQAPAPLLSLRLRTPLSSLSPASSLPRVHPRSMTPLVMNAQFDRRTFGKLVGGGAALVLGKKVLDGGEYTGTPDLTGQVAIVTGANTGLGKETCVR
eukprot:34714-Hanusia_phi.AAC.2